MQEPLSTHIERYKAQGLASGKYTLATVETYGHYLREFLLWCSERSLETPEDVTKTVLQRYQRYLFHRKVPTGPTKGNRLSKQSQCSSLQAIKALFRYLVRSEVLAANPASELEMPRIRKKLPSDVFSVDEVEDLMQLPDLSTPKGQRDRAVLELFYATGVRRQELVSLDLHDLDEKRGALLVRYGKGGAERKLPVGERATAYVMHYITHARPILASSSGDALFVGHKGRISKYTVTQMVGRYIRAANLGKKGSCHLLRHTMATHMLEGGADMRYIQAMLGHSDMSTTQIYTRISLDVLTEVHRTTHPGAKLRRRRP